MVIDLGEWNVEAPTVMDWRREITLRLPTFHITDQDVRNHEDHKHLHENVYKWHQDNAGTALMLIWTNRNPTEVESQIILPKHIYLVENDLHFHRTPAVVKTDPDRWFCRALGTMPYVS